MGVRAELVERAVAVDPLAEVGLDDRIATESCVDVYEQPDLDPVAVGERDLVQRLAPNRGFAGQRLGHVGELWEESIEKRSCEELRNPPAFAGSSVERTVVGRLDELDRGRRQERSNQAGNESFGEVGDIGVEEDDHVGADLIENAAERLPFAVAEGVRDYRRARPP